MDKKIWILSVLLLASILTNIGLHEENQQLEEYLQVAINISVKQMDIITEWTVFGWNIHATPRKIEYGCDECLFQDAQKSINSVLNNGSVVLYKPIVLQDNQSLTTYKNVTIISEVSMVSMLIINGSDVYIDGLSFDLNNNSQYAMTIGNGTRVYVSQVNISNVNRSPLNLKRPFSNLTAMN